MNLSIVVGLHVYLVRDMDTKERVISGQIHLSRPLLVAQDDNDDNGDLELHLMPARGRWMTDVMRKIRTNPACEDFYLGESGHAVANVWTFI